MVANASGVPGAATVLTGELRDWGFDLAAPVNAAAWDERLEISKIYSRDDAASMAVARSVVVALRSTRPDLPVEVLRMPTPAPIDGATAGLGTATVLVMVGRDLFR